MLLGASTIDFSGRVGRSSEAEYELSGIWPNTSSKPSSLSDFRLTVWCCGNYTDFGTSAQICSRGATEGYEREFQRGRLSPTLGGLPGSLMGGELRVAGLPPLGARPGLGLGCCSRGN